MQINPWVSSFQSIILVKKSYLRILNLLLPQCNSSAETRRTPQLLIPAMAATALSIRCDIMSGHSPPALYFLIIPPIASHSWLFSVSASSVACHSVLSSLCALYCPCYSDFDNFVWSSGWFSLLFPFLSFTWPFFYRAGAMAVFSVCWNSTCWSLRLCSLFLLFCNRASQITRFTNLEATLTTKSAKWRCPGVCVSVCVSLSVLLHCVFCVELCCLGCQQCLRPRNFMVICNGQVS